MIEHLALRVEGLGKRYRLGRRERYRALRDTLGGALAAPFRALRGRAAEADDDRTLWALRDVSFSVAEGDVLGVIGANGAGKSTLLKVLSRVTAPTEGLVEVHGRVGSLLEVGTGFHPELSGRDNIFLSGAVLGMRRHEIQRRFDEIVAFAEIADFLDTPVKHYSSGMYLRLGFSVAAHLEPEILLVDEVLAVGDAAFQRKCLGKMGEVARGGRTVLFVSHNLTAIQNLCPRALLIAGGHLEFAGTARAAIQRYLTRLAPSDAGYADLTSHPGRPPGMTPILRSIGLRAGEAGYRSTLRTGDDAVFEIVYDTEDLALDYAVLAISSPAGDRVCTVGTHLSPAFADVLHGKGVLECRLPALPLAEGEYSVVITLGTRTPSRSVDEVQDALRFAVELGDYFATGRTLLRGQGFVAQRSEWRVVR